MKQVSAIITTYKRAPHMVRRAAESVLNQSYENIELIIVDDSPSDYDLRDEVKAMAEDLDERVRYIQHETNMGACAARNTGIREACGDFIAFLDDDDEWLPQKIEKQMAKFKSEDKDLALVYCGYYVINTAEKTKKVFDMEFMEGMVFDRMIYGNYIGSNSFPLIKKNVLVELGGFDVKLKAAQDFEMWLRICKKYKVAYVEEPLVNYYIHAGEQITKNNVGRAEAFLRIVDLNYDYLKKHRKAYANMLFKAVFDIIHIDKSQCRKLFWRAFCIYPFYIRNDLVAIKWLYIMPFIKKYAENGEIYEKHTHNS